MGMYSIDTSSAVFDLPLLEGFEGTEVELQELMVEGYQDQLAMFETGLLGDMKAAMGKIQGLDEETIESIQEGVLGDIWAKIKAFFQKLWQKVKSIFRAFMARFDSVFMKSNKEFVNKYRNDVLKKSLTDFKVTYRKRTSKNVQQFPPIVLNSSGSQSFGEKKFDDAIEKFDSDDYTCEILNKTIQGLNINEVKDYEKEAIDELFEEEEEHEDIDINEVMTDLLTAKKEKKDFETASKSIDKEIGKVINELNKHQNDIAKEFPVKKGEGGQDSGIKSYDAAISTHGEKAERTSGADGEIVKKGNLKAYQKAVRLNQMIAQCYQTAIGKYSSTVLKAMKMGQSINRKIWAKAVAYHKKSEDAYLDTISEAVLYEWDTMDQELVTEAKKDNEAKKAKKGKRKGAKVGAEADVEECND